ncbi:MAG: protein kinase [Polyangiaceae bacterium]
MATVYVGTARGDLGFRRLVAIKRPHPHLAEDPEALHGAAGGSRRRARAARQRRRRARRGGHRRGCPARHGLRRGRDPRPAPRVGIEARAEAPPSVVLRIVLDACAGLAAIHEARDEDGAPLGLVHRDISPQNILIGLDGLARISDFGTAKSALSARPSTTQGTLKGKLAYMAPEYVGRGRLDRRVDVFALGVVLWECLAGKRLFRGTNDADTLDRVQREEAPPLSEVAPELGARFDEVTSRALRKRPEDRWESAEAFGAAVAAAAQAGEPPASHAEVGRAVRDAVHADLEKRRAAVRARLAELDASPRSAGTSSLASSAWRIDSTGAPTESLAPVAEPETVRVEASPSSAPAPTLAGSPSGPGLAGSSGGPGLAGSGRAIVVVLGILAAVGALVGVRLVAGDDTPPATSLAASALVSSETASSGGVPEPSATASAPSAAVPSPGTDSSSTPETSMSATSMSATSMSATSMSATSMPGAPVPASASGGTTASKAAVPATGASPGGAASPGSAGGGRRKAPPNPYGAK